MPSVLSTRENVSPLDGSARSRAFPSYSARIATASRACHSTRLLLGQSANALGSSRLVSYYNDIGIVRYEYEHNSGLEGGRTYTC